MSLDASATAADRYAAVAGPVPRKLSDVPGWLTVTDNMLFTFLLTRQNRVEAAGDLMELGVYQGRTAIHIGKFRKPGERFTVCDLFDEARDAESIRPGARKAYRTLTQDTFERNFLAFHDELPVIVRGLTETILDHATAGSCRFIHIDASHMYEHVHGDMLSARTLLRPDGVVVFDDYRTEHCPGTAAAVWEAMATEGLRVICVSANKFYGTWGDPKAIQDDLIAHVATLADHRCDVQEVMGQRLIRLAKAATDNDGKTLGKLPTNAKESAALLAESQKILHTAQLVLRNAAAQSIPNPRRSSSPLRRATIAVLPPAVVGAIRKRRAAAREHK